MDHLLSCSIMIMIMMIIMKINDDNAKDDGADNVVLSRRYVLRRNASI